MTDDDNDNFLYLKLKKKKLIRSELKTNVSGDTGSTGGLNSLESCICFSTISADNAVHTLPDWWFSSPRGISDTNEKIKYV